MTGSAENKTQNLPTSVSTLCSISLRRLSKAWAGCVGGGWEWEEGGGWEGGGGGGGSLRAPGPRNTPDWKSCEFVEK